MSTADLTSVNDQLAELNDRQAIADLITRLGRMLDDKSFEDASTILADDVTVQTPGGSARGPEAVVAQARRNHTVRTQHVITDVLIDLDGDHAEAGANLVVTFVPDSEDPEATLAIGNSDQAESRLTIGNSDQAQSRLTIGERYHFKARRGIAGWRLARIEVQRVWSTQPLGAGARVVETDRGETAVAS